MTTPAVLCEYSLNSWSLDFFPGSHMMEVSEFLMIRDPPAGVVDDVNVLSCIRI